MKATQQHRQPVPLAETFTRWMSTVDGCPDCDNVQPPRAACPGSLDDTFICSYECTDCGATWTRHYEEGEV